MKHILFVLTCLGMVCTAHAQERAAIGNVQTQMTWSALSTLINGVSTKTDAVNSRVDQVVVCAKKGMVYAPGQTGADADACLMPAIPPSVTNNLNTLNTTTANTNSTVSNIISCNTQGLVFNGSACVNSSAKTTGTVTVNYGQCSLTKTSTANNAAGADLGIGFNTQKYGQHWCPSGMTMVGVNNGSVNGALCCALKFTSN